ncbi:hypothetical protein M0811_00401 [Anaeramoeba ignava]|uniref:Fibronectin type-III domain-containing protein n=1 Tax=Anaeramoeba ignava TaxID=1746090 RepID=A0A9Q0RDY1_ANAIG|nr:hypothetical protein M0811_00401 [Anaeramoeba ignava]
MKIKQLTVTFFLVLVFLAFAKQTNDFATNSNTQWEMIANLTQQTSTTTFGECVSIYGDFVVIGDSGDSAAFIYQNNGSAFNLEQTLNITNFSSCDSIEISNLFLTIVDSGNFQILIYYYNGSYWNLNQTLIGTDDHFGESVSFTNKYLVVSDPHNSQVLIYYYNGSYWNLNQTLTSTNGHFGESVSISNNILVVSDPHNLQVLIYYYNGSYWNLNQTLTGTGTDDHFGEKVAISKNNLVVSDSDNSQVLIYYYNGSYWNLNQTLADPSSSTSFGDSLSVSNKFIVVSDPDLNQVFFYEFNGTYWNQKQNSFIYQNLVIPQVSLINCTSLFASFECYWDEVELPTSLKYQINFETNWIDINTPLEQGDVMYKLFDSSFDSMIKGNINYSIQIRVCDLSNFCGDPSSVLSVFTRIGSVQNFQISNLTTDFLNFSWNSPNVPIINTIPDLDHYVFSYLNETDKIVTNVSLVNSITSFSLDNLQCGTDYNISIWACRTLLCEGDDQGEILELSVITKFQEVTNLSCSVDGVNITCSWISPGNCTEIPVYYNLTFKSTLDNVTGIIQANYTDSNFILDIPNQQFEINVSACDSINVCGTILTTSITTGNLSAPTILNSTSEIEEIELNFTKVNQAVNYAISLDNGTNWINFTSINTNGTNVIGTKNLLAGNVEYLVSVRGCADLSCNLASFGLPSLSTPIIAKLGNISSLKCSSTSSEFYCEWNPLSLSEGLKGYSFSYNSTSICLSNSTTNYSVSNLTEGEIYIISVYASDDSNCSLNQYSGLPSTTSIIIQQLTAPTILNSTSEIEEIELNFTKVNQAVNYAISIDNGTNWINFTSINTNGTNVIGTKNLLAGNVEYLVSVRGCADSSCNIASFGLPSLSTPITAKLGNIPFFECIPLITGFYCEWNPLSLSEGVKAYTLSYNSTSICLENSTRNHSVSYLKGGETYKISIYASADSNCSVNQYSGLPSEVFVTTFLPTPTPETSTGESSPLITKIFIGVAIPLFGIVCIVALGVVIKKYCARKRKPKHATKIDEQEIDLENDLEYN